MNDGFGFNEVAHVDWLNEVSRITDKALLTHSEISKELFFDHQLEAEADSFSKSELKNIKQTRQRNKCNAKNYRDRKRSHLEAMKKQLELLHQENVILKKQKVCRSCMRAFSPNVLTSTTTGYQKEKLKHHKCNFDSKDMEIEFQKPEFQTGIRRPKNPKIWIALGILLLVLGLTMHGIKGDKTLITKIELERGQAERWRQQAMEQDKSDYFQIDMKLQESPQPSNQPKNEANDVLLHFGTSNEAQPNQSKEKVSISKDLLLSIQAEFDDIGAYL